MSETERPVVVDDMVGPLSKTCKKCLETKLLSDFYAGRARCKACCREEVREYQDRKRRELGDDAYREYRRECVARSRAGRESSRERQYSRAKHRALKRLVDMYPRAFQQLLAVELDAEARRG